MWSYHKAVFDSAEILKKEAATSVLPAGSSEQCHLINISPFFQRTLRSLSQKAFVRSPHQALARNVGIFWIGV